MSDEKIDIPKDFPDETDKSISSDPEVLAEVKKNRILFLKLERYKEIAKAVGTILQTFRAEALSLTSGVGTLVVGWFQIKKYVVQGKAETRAVGRAQGKVEGRDQERAERKEDRQESSSGSGSGYGSGSGKIRSNRNEESTSLDETKVLVTTEGPATSVMTDPMSYITIVLPIVFIWSSIVAWIKRKKKLAEEGGRRNAD